MTFRHVDQTAAFEAWIASDEGRRSLELLFGEPVETVSLNGKWGAYEMFLREQRKQAEP